MAPSFDTLTITRKIAGLQSARNAETVSRQDTEQAGATHRLFYEWHGQDLRIKETNRCPTISATMGMGGASQTTPILIATEKRHTLEAAQKVRDEN